jgi:hypothetical protein
LLGEQAARERPDTDRKEEGALIDGNGAAATVGCAYVGQHHLPGGEDQPGTCTGNEAGDDEFRIPGRPGTPQVAEGRHEAADCKRRPAPEPVRQLPRRDRRGETRQTIGRNRHADRRGRHAERLRIEGEGRHHGAEAELVHGDEHAHPNEHSSFKRHAAGSDCLGRNRCSIARRAASAVNLAALRPNAKAPFPAPLMPEVEAKQSG